MYSGTRTVEDTIGKIAQWWELCSPGTTGGFPVLDRFLLRDVLGHLFHARMGRSWRQATRVYRHQIGRMLDRVHIQTGRDAIEEFLKYKTYPDVPALLKDASGNREPGHVDHSHQVLARATLLLRLATGSVAGLLRQSQVDFFADLEFWWRDERVRRRLWSVDDIPNSFLDLWDDIGDALDGVDQWTPPAGHEVSRWRFWNDEPVVAGLLSTSERVFFWGLG